jgi:hypothetical protein
VAVSFTFSSFLTFLILEGGKGGMRFFLKKILDLKGTGGCGFIYLLFFG